MCKDKKVGRKTSSYRTPCKVNLNELFLFIILSTHIYIYIYIYICLFFMYHSTGGFVIKHVAFSGGKNSSKIKTLILLFSKYCFLNNIKMCLGIMSTVNIPINAHVQINVPFQLTPPKT